MKNIAFAELVKAVETAENELGLTTGREKRDFAVRMINAAVDIPWLPEWVEAIVFGWMIDLAIYLFNRWWGHRWIDQSNPDTENVQPETV